MDYALIRLFIDIVQFVITGGVGIYVYVVNRHRVTATRIAQLEQNLDLRLDDYGERLARLEQDARHAPSHDDLKRVHQRLDTVSGELKQLNGEFAGARRTLELIHEFLLNHPSRGAS